MGPDRPWSDAVVLRRVRLGRRADVRRDGGETRRPADPAEPARRRRANLQLHGERAVLTAEHRDQADESVPERDPTGERQVGPPGNVPLHLRLAGEYGPGQRGTTKAERIPCTW